jgi:hypothetical protein
MNCCGIGWAWQDLTVGPDGWLDMMKTRESAMIKKSDRYG